MNLILTVLEIVAPVFFLATIGVVWVRAGLEYDIQFVARLTTILSVPCLIFVALMEMEIDHAALRNLTLATLLGYALLTVFAVLFVRLTQLETRTFLAPVIMGNTGNIGLPLALFAFGDEGLGYAVIIFSIMAVYAFTFGIAMVSGSLSLRVLLKEPMIPATLFGALFLLAGWQTPEIVTSSMRLIGQMAIPMMLITLGVAVARLRPAALGQAIWISASRLVLCLIAGIIAATVFELPTVAFAVLTLQISTPVAVTSYLLAEKYGADANAVAGLVVVSTVISVLALPITLAFFV